MANERYPRGHRERPRSQHEAWETLYQNAGAAPLILTADTIPQLMVRPASGAQPLSAIDFNTSAPFSLPAARMAVNTSSSFFDIFGVLYLNRILGISVYAPANSLVIDPAGSLGVGTASVGSSAKLQVDSTAKGFLPPRMTTAQRRAISNPAEGLLVYDTTLDCYMQMGPLCWLPISRSPHVLDLEDDFLAGSNTNAAIGNLGWIITNGTVSDASEAGHPGITTRTANNQITSLRTKVNNASIYAADLRYLCWIVKTDSTVANTEIRLGLSSNVNNNSPVNAIHFKYDSAVESTWKAETVASSVATSGNTGVTVTPNTWYRLELTYDGTAVRFYVNGTLTNSITTNIPSSAMLWYCQLESTTAADRTISLDYTRLVLNMER